MWLPFRKKKLVSHPYREMLIKSVTLPESQPDWKLFAKKPTDWDNLVALVEGYNASPVVYTCVEKRATLTSSVPWYAARKTKDGETERLPDSHPLNRLINMPNPDQSWLEFMHCLSQNLDLAGNGYASIIRGGARDEPIALWPLSPVYMKIKPGNEQLVDHYVYEQSGAKKTIEANDMVQLRLPNPNDPIFGMPVLMAAGRATDIDRESGNWQKSSLQNKTVSNLHVEVPPETQPDQVEAIRKALKERSGSAHADEAIVSSGKVNLLSRSAQELDFVNSKKAIWGEICAVFGLSMSNLGFTESVNLANAEAMDKALWKNTIIPRLELIKRQLNNQLARDFGEDVCLEYDTGKVDALQENMSELLANAQVLYDRGFSWKALNKRFELGFDEDDLPEEIDMFAEQEEESPISEDSEEVKSLLRVVGYGK